MVLSLMLILLLIVQKLRQIDKINRQIGPLLQQGKLEEAEKLIQQALELAR